MVRGEKVEAFKARIISNGRVTIDKTVRKLLDLKEGDVVNVHIEKVEAS